MNYKAIIGLGNPGPRFFSTRHNIGFRIVDELVVSVGGSWKKRDEMECAEITLHDHSVLVIKPQTFMNNSGRVCPFLQKKGIMADQLLVVHDELEKPFGNLSIKQGGSAKGHNGLKSIIGVYGPDFSRLRFGIGRPEDKNEVPDYVLAPFKESMGQVQELIQKAVEMLISSG